MAVENLIDVYKRLGLTRTNNLWSWGASNDQFIVLQVWQDEYEKTDEGRAFFVRKGRIQDYSSLGFSERLRHLEEHRLGKPCYLLVCRAKDPLEKISREMLSFNKKDLFVSSGDFFEDDNGDLLLGVEERRIKIVDVPKLYGSA